MIKGDFDEAVRLHGFEKNFKRIENKLYRVLTSKNRNKKEKKKYRCENTASARKNFDFSQWKETTRALILPVTRERGRVTKMHASMHEI